MTQMSYKGLGSIVDWRSSYNALLAAIIINLPEAVLDDIVAMPCRQKVMVSSWTVIRLITTSSMLQALVPK